MANGREEGCGKNGKTFFTALRICEVLSPCKGKRRDGVLPGKDARAIDEHASVSNEHLGT